MSTVAPRESAFTDNPHCDTSGLRARLGGQVVAQRSIEAELRAAMLERETGTKIVDVSDNARSRWR